MHQSISFAFKLPILYVPGGSTSLEILERLCVNWLVLSSIQQDLNRASITTVATLQFQAIQQLY